VAEHLAVSLHEGWKHVLTVNNMWVSVIKELLRCHHHPHRPICVCVACVRVTKVCVWFRIKPISVLLWCMRHYSPPWQSFLMAMLVSSQTDNRCDQCQLAMWASQEAQQ